MPFNERLAPLFPLLDIIPVENKLWDEKGSLRAAKSGWTGRALRVEVCRETVVVDVVGVGRGLSQSHRSLLVFASAGFRGDNRS
jgi:hypothetical protein